MAFFWGINSINTGDWGPKHFFEVKAHHRRNVDFSKVASIKLPFCVAWPASSVAAFV